MSRLDRSVTGIALVLAGALLTAPLSSAWAATFGSPHDVQEITAIENRMATETDIDKVMPYFADGAILADIMAPGWYVGRDQIRAAAAPQLADLKSIKFRMEEINVASDGQLACAAMRIRFDKIKKDNSPLTMTIRQLDAFKRIGGQWRIIQRHLSVPVEPNTATPIFDGEAPGRGPLAWQISSAKGPAVPAEQGKAEIRAWLAAMAVPKTIDEMLTFYGPGNDTIIFDFWSPRELRGSKEIRDFYAPQFVGVLNMKIRIPYESIDTDGVFGMEISQQNLQINMKDGTSQRVSFRQSDCVRRIGNKWYSFFEMGSFPVDAKTGKGILVDPAQFK